MITLELELVEANLVLQALADRPFREVAPLVQKVQESANKQLMEQQAQEKANGTTSTDASKSS